MGVAAGDGDDAAVEPVPCDAAVPEGIAAGVVAVLLLSDPAVLDVAGLFSEFEVDVPVCWFPFWEFV